MALATDLATTSVKKLADRIVKTDNINAQQIKSVLKQRFNIVSKNTHKHLLAHETRCGWMHEQTRGIDGRCFGWVGAGGADAGDALEYQCTPCLT